MRFSENVKLLINWSNKKNKTVFFFTNYNIVENDEKNRARFLVYIFSFFCKICWLQELYISTLERNIPCWSTIVLSLRSTIQPTLTKISGDVQERIQNCVEQDWWHLENAWNLWITLILIQKLTRADCKIWSQ